MAIGVRYGGPGSRGPGIPGGKGPNRATEFVVKTGPKLWYDEFPPGDSNSNLGTNRVETPRLMHGYINVPNLLLTTLALFAADSQLIKRDATLQNTKPAPAVQAFQQHNLLTSTLRKFPFGSDDGMVDNLVQVIQVPMASPQGTNFLLLSAANPIPIGEQSTASAPSDPTRNGYADPVQNRVLLDVAAVATAPVGTQSTQSAPSTQGVLSWDSRSNTLYLPGPLPVGEQRIDSAPHIIQSLVVSEGGSTFVLPRPLPQGSQETSNLVQTPDVSAVQPPNLVLTTLAAAVAQAIPIGEQRVESQIWTPPVQSFTAPVIIPPVIATQPVGRQQTDSIPQPAPAVQSYEAPNTTLFMDPNVRYVIGNGSAINGNGLFPVAATIAGGPGAYISPPGNSFTGGLEWRMISGNTLDMGGTGLTTGHNATIVKYGSGANFIINGTNAILLNSSTATGCSVSDLNLVRTGAVSGTGFNVGQTTGMNIQRCTITGSSTNIDATNAVTLTVNGCTLGASSTEYGVRATQATTTCSNWSITSNTFNTGIGIDLNVSDSANSAGKYTGLAITSNTFNASASSAIIMQSVMNLTGSAHTLEVLNATQIKIVGGVWPAYNAGQNVFLTGFNDPANYDSHSVVSVVGDTLTVGGTALAVEAAGLNKGVGLIDSTRMFIAPEISLNTCTTQSETPMLLASFVGGRIHHNTISGQIGSGTKVAAGIELIYSSNLTVDFNTVGNTTGFQLVDNAGIFTDGGCDTVTVSNNTISNVVLGGQDNSGQGSAFFYAKNCIHENNVYLNCYRGTWAGGSAGAGNIIRNNSYTGCDIGIDINCSVAIGAFDYRTGHTFSGNRIDMFSCPDNFTQYGATNKGAGKSKKHNKKIERYIARYKDKLYEFVSLNELEQFVADVKDDEKIKPKRERSAIKITLSPDFKEEIEEEIDIPARLQSMPTTAAMAQIRRIDQIFEKILAQMQDDENDDEETLLWLM
jgi:hypothetical protein